MKNFLSWSLLLLMANSLCSSVSHARSTTPVYKMPIQLVNRLQDETKQRERGDCEQKKRELFSTEFYSFHHKLLLFIGLPDYFCHARSFLPITVDSQGHWEAGAVIESSLTELSTDENQQLWLISHWEVEAVYPLLHHSLDGLHWQEISLPKQRKIDCCFEWIKQICLTESHIQIKFAGMEDAPVEYWQTSVSDSLKSAPNWQKLNAEQWKYAKHCQNKLLTKTDWQRKHSSRGSEVKFQSATEGFQVIVPRWLK